MSRMLCALFLVATVAPAAAFDLGGFLHHGPRGNGDLVATSYEVAPISVVVLKCGLDIDVTFGTDQKVTLRMDDNLVQYFKFDVRDGILFIDDDKHPRPSRDARLELTLRSLDRLTVEGAGDISIRGYDGERLALEVDGAGDLTADGKTGEIVVSVSGAGDVDARHLEARRADVSVNGAGDVDIYASEHAEVEINGVGDVDVWGDPAELTKNVHGVGDITQR